MRPQRIACTVAPKTWFGGRDHLGGKALTDALRDLGHELFLLDTECFYQKDAARCAESLRQLRQFAPELALGTPNAGYGLGAQLEVKGRLANVFTDLLQIPLALLWDDPLGQFSGHCLGKLPASPAESQPGALEKLRGAMNHPLLRHCGWDTGHLQTVAGLGLVDAEKITCNLLPAQKPYLDFGKTHDLASSFLHDVVFVGNVYLNQITADPLHQIPEIVALAERIAERKLAGFASSAWELLLEELEKIPAADRARLKLSPDESFFWQAYRYLVWVAVNTRVRMGVLTGIRHPVAFYGAFADPAGIGKFSDYPNIQYQGSVDYLAELPAVFHQSRITVDVTNQLAQRSAPGKFFECFAAGGFMLLDRRPDLIAKFGDAAEKISYRTTDELNAKIDFYRTHEADRKELARHFQEAVQRDHTPQAWLARIVESAGSLLKVVRASGVAQVSQPAVSPISKSAAHRKPRRPGTKVASAGLETRDTADLEVRATAATTKSSDPTKETFLADAMWNQRETLAAARPQTRALHDALRDHMPKGHPGDLPFHEWGQLMAAALEFQPDLILEIGRGYGNSTLAFTQAAHLMMPRGCRVLSVCRTPWGGTRDTIAKSVTPEWFAPLTPLEMDWRAFDCESALLGAKRVLIFWDAHGYDVAECVLGRLMPILASREHLVLMHDLGDARYQDDAASYGDFGTWKGEEIWPGPRVRLGNILATVQQAVSIVDFTSRNRVTLHSAAHSLHNGFSAASARAAQLAAALQDDFFQRQSGCAWFTLNESSGPYHFPHVPSSAAVKPISAQALAPKTPVSQPDSSDAEPEAGSAENLHALRVSIGRMLGRNGSITEGELLAATNALNDLLNAEDVSQHLTRPGARVPEALVPLVCLHLQSAWRQNDVGLATALENLYGQCVSVAA